MNEFGDLLKLAIHPVGVDELRLILAKLDGWNDKPSKPPKDMGWGASGKKPDWQYIHQLPNYPMDLNACHEIEKKLPRDDYGKNQNGKRINYGYIGGHAKSTYDFFVAYLEMQMEEVECIISAPPLKRTIALIRALTIQKEHLTKETA